MAIKINILTVLAKYLYMYKSRTQRKRVNTRVILVKRSNISEQA